MKSLAFVILTSTLSWIFGYYTGFACEENSDIEVIKREYLGFNERLNLGRHCYFKTMAIGHNGSVCAGSIGTCPFPACSTCRGYGFVLTNYDRWWLPEYKIRTSKRVWASLSSLLKRI